MRDIVEEFLTARVSPLSKGREFPVEGDGHHVIYKDKEGRTFFRKKLKWNLPGESGSFELWDLLQLSANPPILIPQI